jgi:hypothetical protein
MQAANNAMPIERACRASRCIHASFHIAVSLIGGSSVCSTEVRASRQRGKRAFEVERLSFVLGGFGKSAAPVTLPP